MYAEVYRWFTETSRLGLAEQSAQLMNPKAAAKEEDIAAAIELWEERSSRLARHGVDYALPNAFKKGALKKMLVGKVKETYELWETEKLSFEEILRKNQGARPCEKARYRRVPWQGRGRRRCATAGPAGLGGPDRWR